MRRFAHCLILLMAPCQAAWADDAFSQSQRGACVYSDASPGKPAAPSRSTTHEANSSAAAPRANRSGEASGGGGSEEDLMQRMRAPRWHSFLPGMFR